MSDVNDILIVGGGPVGSVLALALLQRNIPVTLLEAREQGASHLDQRALALSYGTRQILERLGVWHELEPQATAIETIHISQRGSLGRSRLRASEHGQPALGYVLSYGALCASLDKALTQNHSLNILYRAEATAIEPAADKTTVTFRHDQTERQLSSLLVALADGGRSLGEIPGIKRETKEYGHDALISKVSCELPHNHVAYERFTPAGPMALLPNGDRDFSLVWTGRQEEIQPLLTLEENEFLRQLHMHFGDRVGRFLSVGKRMSFPLKISSLNPVTAPHLVVIGNAAQTMHPVAGQGFNVGLRDAWELAYHIAATAEINGSAAWGGESMLKTYRQGRQTDTKRGLLFTDFLVNLFSNDLIGVSALRGAGIGLLDMIKPAKNHLVNKMSFGSHG